jgi:predicted amidohydrolase
VTMEALNVSVFPDDFRYRFIETVPDLNGGLFQKFREFAKKHGVYVVGGLYNRREGKAYNSGILFGPSGEIEEIYDKVQLWTS